MLFSILHYLRFQHSGEEKFKLADLIRDNARLHVQMSKLSAKINHLDSSLYDRSPGADETD